MVDLISDAATAALPDAEWSRPSAHRLPSGTCVYAVGDIHGRADLLAETFVRIDDDRQKRTQPRTIEVFLGDYVDRGPASREVLDMLVDRGQRHETVFLKGNHEELLLQFIGTQRFVPNWSKLGGRQTLASYGLQPSLTMTADQEAALAAALNARLPAAHRDFLRHLQTFFSCGDYFFVHAGIKPGIALNRQREADLLWIRDEFLNFGGPFEKMIVHGHSPVLAPEFRTNRINIDTGAYATGRLTCLRIDGDDACVI
jgi:serine/threonine protein phosphatase 1